MIYYNKLRTLLCEVEEIKKDLEELRFGTRLKLLSANFIIDDKFISSILRYNNTRYFITDRYDRIEEKDFFKIYKIIGNDIEERHIRLYLKKYNSYYDIKDDLLRLWTCNTNNISGGEFCNLIENIKYNNSKPFYQQDEEVYRQLVEYFNNIK